MSELKFFSGSASIGPKSPSTTFSTLCEENSRKNVTSNFHGKGHHFPENTDPH